MLHLKRVLAAIALLILLVLGFVWFSGKSVDFKLARAVPAIGNDSIISVQAGGPNGVKSFSASVEQNGQGQTVYLDETRSKQTNRVYTFSAGKKQASFLKEGPARLILNAASNDFRGRTTTLSQDIQVVLRPPSIVADGKQHYINQGGSELVTLDLVGSWTEAGVRFGTYSAGSVPLPGQPENSNSLFSLFPYPC